MFAITKPADWAVRNVAAQRSVSDSVWSTYRSMLHLRRSHPALSGDRVRLPSEAHHAVVTYRRDSAEGSVRVVANLTAGPVHWALPAEETVTEVLLSTGRLAFGPEGLRLGAYSGGVVALAPCT